MERVMTRRKKTEKRGIWERRIVSISKFGHVYFAVRAVSAKLGRFKKLCSRQSHKGEGQIMHLILI
jgi:transposase